MLCSKVCNVRELIDDVVPERPRLENAPLKAVICQARFPRQLSLGDDEVRPIQRALNHRYPVFDEEQAIEVAHRRIFRFRDAGSGWIATIGPEAISLETTEYVGMKDLLIRWSELATATAEAFELTAQTRLGLRYVNELDCPAPHREDLSGWVRRELLMPLGAQPRAEHLLRFISQAQFRQPDGSSCNMRHGIAPSETDQDRAVFLLDLDCFRGEAVEFDPVAQIRNLARLNESAYEYFNWAFSERTVEHFGPERPGPPPGGTGWVTRPRGTQRTQSVLADYSLHFDRTATTDAGCGDLGRGFLVEVKSDYPDPVPARSDSEDSAPLEPLAAVLASMRESIDIPVVDLARMIGLGRRQFYNLLDGNPTSTETEARIRRLAAAIERLAAVTEGGPQTLRAAVLTPIGPDAINFFEVAAAGDDRRLAATVEALLVQIETRGIRRTRRAIPRPVPPGADEQRKRLMRESLADRSTHRPKQGGGADGGG